MKKLVCAYCGKAAEGQYSIDMPGDAYLPDVHLCKRCGASVNPSIEAIHNKLQSYLEPMIFWMKVARGEISPVKSHQKPIPIDLPF
jgi:hypothetical protein